MAVCKKLGTINNLDNKQKICWLSKPVYFRIETPINKFQEKYKNFQPNRQLACEQHSHLIEAIKSFDIKTFLIPSNDNVPYQVFTRDIFIGELEPIVLCNPSEKIRKFEKAIVKGIFNAKGINYLEPCSVGLEGGDVIIHKNNIYIGIGDRTKEDGVQWIKRRFSSKYQIFLIRLQPGFLHLDMVFNLLSTNCCVAYKEGIQPSSFSDIKHQFKQIVELNEKEYENMSTNFLIVGDKKIVCSENISEKVILAAKNIGFQIISVRFDEIQKGGGSIRCSTNFSFV